MSEAAKLDVRVTAIETLHGLKWEIEKPKGSVVLFEGMQEHTARYDYFAKCLNKAGFSVYGLDVYGQGKNVDEDLSNLGYMPTDGFDKQLAIYDKLIVSLKEKGPVYVFAHSMGSYMAQGFIQKYSKDIDKLVLCGSGAKNEAAKFGFILAVVLSIYKNKERPAGLLSGMMFGNFNKRIPNPETKYEWLSYNKENIQKYIDDPLCGYRANNGFCLEFLRFLKGLYKGKNLQNIRTDLPIFIISGLDDPVSNYSKDVTKLKNMYNALGNDNISTKVYQPGRHEILNEDLKDDVISDVIAFFNK